MPSPDLRLLAPFWNERVDRTVLKNGLVLLLKPDASAPVCSVQVWVRSGSLHEGRLLGSGLSHYLEHLLFKGTEKRAGREISATVQAHGGNINAYTTFDRTVYYIDLPSDHLDVALDLLADMTFRSTLLADEVARERDVILREIDMGEDDPESRFSHALFETAFREHPYRLPIIGHRPLFERVTRDDLLAYYHDRYAPNNCVLVVAGRFDPEAVKKRAEELFGAAPRRALAPVILPEEPPPLSPREEHREEEVSVSRAALAWLVPGLAHEDAPTLDLLSLLLGHGDSSVLWQVVREKARLVHSIDASCWNPGTAGLFTVAYVCDPEKRAAAAAAVQAELSRRARVGFTSAEINKAVRQAVVSEINARKTMSGQAARLGLAEVVVGDLGYGRRYFQQLGAVTSARLQRALRTFLVPERRTAVSCNPVGKVTVASGSSRGATELPDFQEIVLPNGAKLLLQPTDKLPNLHLRLAFAGGPLFETAGKRGATALLATLLTKDTRQRSAAAVATAIERLGGNFHPFSGNNSFGLSLEILPSDFTQAFPLLTEAALSPAFKPATVELEREAHLAELKEDADDVVTLGRKLLRKTFFGDHPLAIESGGAEEDIASITSRYLAALHKKLVVAGNVVLAVAGDFSPKTLLPTLRAFLQTFPNGRPEVPAAVAGVYDPQPVARVEPQPRQQAVVFQAFPCAGVRGGREHIVSEVADELFSGMSSRLFERVREEKGLAYFVRSSRVLGVDTGMFFFFAGTAPGKDAEVLAEFEAEIARVAAAGVTPDELTRCQTRLKAGRRMAQQTNSARALHAALHALYGLPVNDLALYDESIDSVTAEDLSAFAKRSLLPTKRVQLVVKPLERPL